ncbi:LysE family translocator [Grimontia indica]|nr:LysE family transporter [Grimontia indica]
MFELWAYAFGIMYSPGPVNLLGLNGGLQNRTREDLGFFAGVATAMLILFISMLLIGGTLVSTTSLPYISIIGCSYILYIAWKLAKAKVDINKSPCNKNAMTFHDGLVLQLLNPKGIIATLPIVTIQFPAAGIHGMESLFWIGSLTILAFGAPASYSLIGSLLGKRIANPVYFRVFNISMSVLLVYVSLDIAHQQTYLPWFGQ